MNEKYTDPIDVGSQTGLQFVEDSIKSVQRLIPQPRILKDDEEFECESCGSTHPDFPRERYLAGYSLCVICQSYIEKSNKQYNKLRRGEDN